MACTLSYVTFLCVSVLLHLACSSETNITLTTKKGPIIGVRMDPNPLTNVSYDAFIGILYGNITARFQMAVAPDSWTTPKYTQTDGSVCPQSGTVYNEQCLYLNVYSPVNASGSPGTLPVMAFLHGGGLIGLSSDSKRFGPDFLVPGDVVLVTMNYRLGAPGFLTLGSKVAPGNQGLFDVALSLQWIQDEISVFGGDPTRVTLFGQSAGAFITQWYNLSPYTTELFTRSIAESGGGLRDYATYSSTEGARRAKLLATALNCSNTNDSVILACLQAANITDIIDNQDIELNDELLTVYNVYTPWMPVIDSNETADTPFFGDSLENLMPQALARGKPMIIGFNSDEGISKWGDDSWQLAEANLDYFIPAVALAKNLSDDQKTAAASEIKSFYFPDTVDDDKAEDIVQLYTAAMFGYCSVKMARYFSNMTYGYIFSYVGSWATLPSVYASFEKYKLTGVTHGDELNYIFYTTGSAQYLETCPSNQPNLDIRDQMVSWWTSFAKNGTPGSWDKISEAGYLVIDSDLSYLNTTYVDSQYYDLWAGLAAMNASSSNSTSAASTLVSSTTISTVILCVVFKFISSIL